MTVRQGCSPDVAGGPHDVVGNGDARQMVTEGAQAPEQNPAYRATHPQLRIECTLQE